MSDDETFSQSSQSSLSIDDENILENVIRPYQFEPEFSSSEESVEEEGDLEGEQQHADVNFRSGLVRVSLYIIYLQQCNLTDS